MKRIIQKTADGSHTLFLPDLDETYHSVHGAMQEAQHVFIKSGLQHMTSRRQSIDLLEVGFGTGLNAMLTLLFGRDNGLAIRYTGLEPYPVEESMVQELNYMDEGFGKVEADLFREMHHLPWNNWTELYPGFQLFKDHKKVEEIEIQSSFDLIYYDAFGPRAQPDMWTDELMVRMFSALRGGGVLVSYCAKGSFKRGLKKPDLNWKNFPGLRENEK